MMNSDKVNESILHLNKDVTLGSLSLEYAPDMFRWMCDPNVTLNIGLRDKPSLEKTINWVKHALKDPLIHPFAIIYKDQFVGNVIIDRIDNYLRTARLSTYLGDTCHRGKGIGATSSYLALKEGFDKLALNKVWLTIHSGNLPSIYTVRKLGFVLEGILRDEFLINDIRVDLLYLGLLEKDFRKLRVAT
jgi:RimJ/RimL family protein N-acetyltransferase